MSNNLMAKRRRGLRLTIVAVAMGTVGFLFYHMFLYAHVRDSHGPVSNAAATDCPISLPASAQNVHYYVYQRWIEHKEFVRFEAPVQDCIAHAESILRMQPSGSGSLLPMPQDPMLIWSVKIMAPPWFDVWNVKNGLSTSDQGDARIWIDIDRGVFFYKRTD